MISPAYLALWVFVFSVPWENFVIISGFGAISKLMGMLAMGFAVMTAVMHGRLRRWHPFHIAALLFVAWAGVLQMVLNMGPRLPNKFYTFVQLLAVAWMVWELAPSRKGQLGLLLAYVSGAYVAALDTLRVYRTAEGVARRFAAGTFDPNDLAMTLVLALPMAWYLGQALQRPLLRWYCRAYLPVGLLAIGLTGSRGGMLASMVALLVVPLTLSRLTPGRLTAAIVMLVLSGTLAVVYVPDTVKERLATTRTEVEEVRLGGRFKLWKAGINAFAQRPVMGYGTATFKQAITPELGPAAQVAHNSYISVLVEQGLVGFALYAAMFVAVIGSVLRMPFLDRRFGLVLLAALLVTMTPLTWEDRKSVWVVLAVLVALAHAPLPRAGAAVPAQPVARGPVPSRAPRRGEPLRPATAPTRGRWDPGA